MGSVRFMNDPNAADLARAESDRQTSDPRFDPVWRAEEEAKAARPRQPKYDEYDDPRPDVGSGADRKVWVHVGGRWHGHEVLMPAEEAAEMSQHDLDRIGLELDRMGIE